MAKKFVHSISALLIIVCIAPLAYCEESVHRQAPKLYANWEGMNCYIDKDGDFWAWGKLHDFGLRVIDSPMKLESGIKSFSYGSDFSFLVKHDGTLWKLRPKEGENGYALQQVYLPNGKPVEEAEASAFNYESLVLDVEGNLWVSGLFFSKRKTDTCKMRKFLSRIQKIKMNGVNTLAVMESGELFTFGYNRCNELGTGSPKDSHVPMKVRTGGLDPKRIKGFSFGAGQSIAITDDGSLWSWGKSFDGEYYDSAGGAPKYLPAELEGTCTKEDRMPVKSAEWQNVKDIKTRFGTTDTYFVLQQDGKLWDWCPEVQRRGLLFENIEAIAGTGDRLLALQKDGTILSLSKFDEITKFEMPPVHTESAAALNFGVVPTWEPR